MTLYIFTFLCFVQPFNPLMMRAKSCSYQTEISRTSTVSQKIMHYIIFNLSCSNPLKFLKYLLPLGRYDVKCFKKLQKCTDKICKSFCLFSFLLIKHLTRLQWLQIKMKIWNIKILLCLKCTWKLIFYIYFDLR